MAALFLPGLAFIVFQAGTFLNGVICTDENARDTQLENDNASLQKHMADLQAENTTFRADKANFEADNTTNLDIDRLVDNLGGQLSASERKRIILATELNNATTILDNAGTERMNAENELRNTTTRLSEVSSTVTSLTNVTCNCNNLTEELRQEQDNYKNADSLRKQLEIEIREITIRLEEAEAFAMREGKRQIAKLQARIRDLEGEYEVEQRRARESQAGMRKVERQYKELVVLMEDDKRRIGELTGLCDSLSLKLKTYKRQIDEAEEVANIAMNKYRKATTMIEEAESRADNAEKNLQTVRRSRSMSVSREVTRVIKMN